eukprot:3860843-Prymnesium_polylepis.2
MSSGTSSQGGRCHAVSDAASIAPSSSTAWVGSFSESGAASSYGISSYAWLVRSSPMLLSRPSSMSPSVAAPAPPSSIDIRSTISPLSARSRCALGVPCLVAWLMRSLSGASGGSPLSRLGLSQEEGRGFSVSRASVDSPLSRTITSVEPSGSGAAGEAWSSGIATIGPAPSDRNSIVVVGDSRGECLVETAGSSVEVGLVVPLELPRAPASL